MKATHDRPAHAHAWPKSFLAAGGLFLAFLALYARTAAPSVLSGDSAEFQLAAPLLGVPHPTTYPLYILLGKLSTLLVPFGDLAWRVTLVSAIGAALAVALFFRLARGVVGSAPAALVGALALGLTPGLWNAATIAEVYALLLALLAGLTYLLASATLEPERSAWPRLRWAAFVGGLGFTHHGLFAITGLPLLAGYVAWLLIRPVVYEVQTTKTPGRQESEESRESSSQLVSSANSDLPSKQVVPLQLALLALCFAAGLLPWLFPLVQYARYGPFANQDYGLPRHYFWGEPASVAQVFSLLTGGPLRQGIFRAPSVEAALAVLTSVAQRLWFEFGPLGVPLGLLGIAALLRRSRIVGSGAIWIFLSTLVYLLLLGPAVQDAPVFTLPMLLPWALWIAAAVEWALGFMRQRDTETRRHGDTEISTIPVSLSPGLLVLVFAAKRWTIFATTMLLAATLAWGYTRLPYSSKRQLWLFRRFGEATLAQLPPGAAVIAHWEQGMTLQYLVLAERRRPDVWVDVVEPGDVAWGVRAQRYAGRPVFFVGTPADLASLPVELVRADEYADLFVLR